MLQFLFSENKTSISTMHLEVLRYIKCIRENLGLLAIRNFKTKINLIGFI